MDRVRHSVHPDQLIQLRCGKTLHSTHSFGVGEAGNSATESIVIQTDDNISTELGVVSIGNGDIYVGNGGFI